MFDAGAALRAKSAADVSDADLPAWREAWLEAFRKELSPVHARITAAESELDRAVEAEAEILRRASDVIGSAAIALPHLERPAPSAVNLGGGSRWRRSP